MKPARLAVLGIAVVAAGGAALLVSNIKQPVIVQEAPKEVVVPVAAQTVRVLVASADLGIGQTIHDNDIDWINWPKGSVNPGFIQDNGSPATKSDIVGSLVKQPFLKDEPIRTEKLIRSGSGSFMSAILPSGKRALAITIDPRAGSNAGGFILPNDRVDIIRTYRDDETSRSSGAEVLVSETLLSNVRVLAIGQAVQEKNGEKTMGDGATTATLEVDPRQAELIVLAQKLQAGSALSLSLRSVTDASAPDMPVPDRDTSTTVIRYGVATQALKK